MKIQEFGEQGSSIILIQPVDDHDLAVIESEVAAIEKLSENPFHLITVKVDSWNNDLSPWKAPAVFGNEDFGPPIRRMCFQVSQQLLHQCGSRDSPSM